MRTCYECGDSIRECMGSGNWNDFMAAMAGEMEFTDVRELCAKCTLKRDKSLFDKK